MSDEQREMSKLYNDIMGCVVPFNPNATPTPLPKTIVNKRPARDITTHELNELLDDLNTLTNRYGGCCDFSRVDFDALVANNKDIIKYTEFDEDSPYETKIVLNDVDETEIVTTEDEGGQVYWIVHPFW